MMKHVNGYVEMADGGLSKRGSDQVTKAAHQLLKARMDKSYYSTGSEKLAQKLKGMDY